MLQPSMQDFKHDLTGMGDECSCLMVSTFFGTTLLGIGMKITFSSHVATAGSSRLADIWNATPLWHYPLEFLNSSTEISSHPLALLTAVLPKAPLTSLSRTCISGWLTT